MPLLPTTMKKLQKVEKLQKMTTTQELYGDEAGQAAGLPSLKMIVMFQPVISRDLASICLAHWYACEH